MSRIRLLLAGLALIGVAVAAFLILGPLAHRPAILSGYVESEPLYLAAPVSGAVTALDVRRGDRVAAGAFLFAIDDRPLLAQKAQAGGQIAQALAQAAAARQTENQLQAVLDGDRASAAQADREAARAVKLFTEAGVVSRQDAERARTAAETAHAQLAAAQRQAGAAAAQVRAASSLAEAARASQAEIVARLSQTSARAPGPARVEDTFFQAGEWAQANQPILALLPDDRITLRFFVPEQQIARYRLGRRVRFACDGCAAGLSATVSYVSPRPEYTPPVIYSRESRDRLVFLVEARPDHPAALSPGQPVDVTPLGS